MVCATMLVIYSNAASVSLKWLSAKMFKSLHVVISQFVPAAQ